MSQLTIFNSEDEREEYEERVAICTESGVSEEKARQLALDQIENHRFRCEVRDVLRKFQKGGRKHLELYIALVEQKRGQPEAARLREAAREQFQKGNRGDQNDWR